MTHDTLITTADALKDAAATLSEFDKECQNLVDQYLGKLDLSYMGEHAIPAEKLPAIRRNLLGIIARLGDDIQRMTQS